jgi:hypothetical protein
MNKAQIAACRLYSQVLEQTKFIRPDQVLAWLGALQSQDYSGAKWSIGLRATGLTDILVQEAIEDQSILRTWLLRGTLHFVTSQDIRWMLTLISPGIIAGNTRRTRQLGLDEPTFTRSNDILAKALAGARQLNRPALFAILERNGISPEGQRGVYLLQRASLEGLICQGVTERNQPTFLSLDSIDSQTKRMQRDEALVELARRYFLSRGPATLKDFVWWSGLSSVDARAGLKAVEAELIQVHANDQTLWMSPTLAETTQAPTQAALLPGFDEYLLAYQDRSASLDVPRYKRDVPTNGMLPPTMLLNGRVVGTWKRTIKRERAIIEFKPFEPLNENDDQVFVSAARRYADFMVLEEINVQYAIT